MYFLNGKNSMNCLFLATKSLLVFSGMLIACASVFAQNQTLKIGVIGPFTGPSADFGNPMLNGIKLAVDEINAVGGFLGRPLELIVKDDKANPDEGLKQSQALIAEKVSTVVGFCNTGVAAKFLETFQTAKVPLIIPCATGSPLTAKFPAPQSYIFRTSPRDAIQAPFVVNDIFKRGWDKVAIFADKTGYGEAGLQDVLKALDAKQVKPVYIARFDVGVKDLTEEMKAAKAAGAEVIFSYTVGPENAVIAKSKQAIGWKVPQVGPWTLSFPFFIDGAKDAAEGALVAQTFIAEQRATRIILKRIRSQIPNQAHSCTHGGRPRLRRHVYLDVFNVQYPRWKRFWHCDQNSFREHVARLLRRGCDLRQTIFC